MKLPYLNKTPSDEKIITSFGGVDRRDGAGEGSFYDVLNMTGTCSPCASVRVPRGILNFGDQTIYNILAFDVLNDSSVVENAFIADTGTRLLAYYKDNGDFSPHHLLYTSSILSPGKKQLVVSGTKLIFFPDNVYINLLDNTEKGFLGYTKNVTLGNNTDFYYELCLEKCDLDGTVNDAGSYGKLYIKYYTVTSGGGRGNFGGYLSFNTSLLKYDTVEIGGFSNTELNGFYNISNIDMQRKYLVIPCPANDTSDSGTFTISRRIPQMDYVIACKNRLWGCKYGVDANNKAVNEIYASSLGDPTNWYRYEGVSTDAWTAVISSGGAFTGAACFGGNPVFFKENAVIKVYGDYPSEFTIKETAVRGIEKGSSDSAVVVNDVLYYKSYNGIVKYDGSFPVRIDAPLGRHDFKNAVAGTLDNRYFVSMEQDGVRKLYVYDTEMRTWHIESDPGIVSFCRCGNELFMLCNTENGGSAVYSVGGTYNSGTEHQGTSEGDTSWMCESVDMGFETPEHKYVFSVTLRLKLSVGAACEMQISYDRSDDWQTERVIYGAKDGIVNITVKPRRCQSFRLRLSGKGNMVLYSIARRYEKCSRY